MKKRTGAVLAVLAVAAATALALAAGSSARQQAPIKAAWIYVGPHNDGGWSQAHDRGRLAVQKALGTNVITTYKETVPEGPQAAQVIDSLVTDGNKIIFATSFGYMDAMAAAAKKYPDVYFEHATGYKTAKNFANYFGAGEDAIYLSGMAAGAATKNGIVGYIVPFPIPEIIRHANAFALGVQAAHPDAKIKLVWTKSWFDPAKEKKAAESLVAAGADVVGQNVDSPAAGQYAQSKGIPWVGYNSELAASSRRPRGSRPGSTTGACTTSSASRRRRTAPGRPGATGGAWRTGSRTSRRTARRSRAKTKAHDRAKRAAIISGKFYEFQGPLYDQSGQAPRPRRASG